MRKLKNILLLSSIFIITVAFNLHDNKVFFGWQKQATPNLGGRNLADVFFLDSLYGWGVTPYTVPNDTAFIIKTTNGGENWFIIRSTAGTTYGKNKIVFLNSNVGFAVGTWEAPDINNIKKTTNGGDNWFTINEPVSVSAFIDIAVINEDTIYLPFERNYFEGGGVYKTTNGSINWIRQFTSYASVIRMQNASTGFFADNFNSDLSKLYKTTNGGTNWIQISSAGGMTDMVFADSMKGWKVYRDTIKVTTNGGLNWAKQNKLRPPSQASFQGPRNLHLINKDTLWASGDYIYFIQVIRYRGFFYKTTNGGDTWGYQIPDTNFAVKAFYYSKFINSRIGWGYWLERTGVHTTVGGDTMTTYPTDISNNNTLLPDSYILYQNFPNPFNPTTKINYELRIPNYVSIKVYNLQGKEISILVNEKKNSGSYSVNFDAAKYNLSSGMYFYSLLIDGTLADTKKMILVK